MKISVSKYYISVSKYYIKILILKFFKYSLYFFILNYIYNYKKERKIFI